MRGSGYHEGPQGLLAWKTHDPEGPSVQAWLMLWGQQATAWDFPVIVGWTRPQRQSSQHLPALYTWANRALAPLGALGENLAFTTFFSEPVLHICEVEQTVSPWPLSVHRTLITVLPGTVLSATYSQDYCGKNK